MTLLPCSEKILGAATNYKDYLHSDLVATDRKRKERFSELLDRYQIFVYGEQKANNCAIHELQFTPHRFLLPLNQNCRKAEKIQAPSSNPNTDEIEGTCSALCTCAPLGRKQNGYRSMKNTLIISIIKLKKFLCSS